MKTDIPVIRAVLKTNEDGIRILSMVQDPAIMINYIQMNEAKNRIKMAITDESKGIVFAPMLVPDLPIYRNMNGKEFYLIFDRETIFDTAIKMTVDKTDHNIDTNHDHQLVNDIVVFEKVVTDEKRFGNPVGFEDMPIGTLYGTAKVNNPTQLAKIKSGEINGWSIDGMFDFELKEMLSDKEIQSVIQNILS